MIRLFIALKIPDEVKDKLLHVCYELSDSPELFKQEKPEKIHLTLKFIGEVEEELVSSIAKKIAFVEEYNSFNFNVIKFGFFYRNDVPNILWAGLQTDESINRLVEQLNERLSIFSIPVERRKFKPHLTMLRLKKNPGKKFILKFEEHSFANWNFNSSKITLIKSELFPTGARYTDIKKYNLK
ncbi:MAG: RNA 2',3'-cyclic phosphodiesterase [Ignavibacteriaceae bacterium]|jgi:2'-5' RNA ligase